MWIADWITYCILKLLAFWGEPHTLHIRPIHSIWWERSHNCTFCLSPRSSLLYAQVHCIVLARTTHLGMTGFISLWDRSAGHCQEVWQTLTLVLTWIVIRRLYLLVYVHHPLSFHIFTGFNTCGLIGLVHWWWRRTRRVSARSTRDYPTQCASGREVYQWKSVDWEYRRWYWSAVYGLCCQYDLLPFYNTVWPDKLWDRYLVRWRIWACGLVTLERLICWVKVSRESGSRMLRIDFGVKWARFRTSLISWTQRRHYTHYSLGSSTLPLSPGIASLY